MERQKRLRDDKVKALKEKKETLADIKQYRESIPMLVELDEFFAAAWLPESCS